MLSLLQSVGLTEEQALRMMSTAKTYGLVNFPHAEKLYGLTYNSQTYTLGEADFSNVKR